MKKDKNAKKPLTLEVLAEYNQEVFLPALDAHFATKTELKEFKKEFKEFKNENLTNQDKMLKKLDTLLIEKEAREHREEKENKLWAIIINSLKEHRILSPKELDEIAILEIF